MFLLIGILFLILQGCSSDEEIPVRSDNQSEITDFVSSNAKTVDRPAIKSRNQVVVRYKPHLTASQRYLKRYQNHVTNYEPCSCGDSDLELWIIDNTQISVEDVVDNLETDADVEGDYQLYFSIDDQQVAFGVPTQNDLIAPPGSRNTVNIAIIDTGVDYASFSKPFLYGYSRNQSCPSEVSGWDFVNGDPNPQDDAGHGTLVTKLITKELDKKNIDHRILAVKAFNENGRGSYWNIICAMNYVIHKRPRIDIVNMSFGWYIEAEEILPSKQDILKTMINSRLRRTLFVASAGNVTPDSQNGPYDVDGGQYLHFPSGYNSINLLTVGGCDIKGGLPDINPVTNVIQNARLATRSNYGNISIDMVAPFSGYFPAMGGLEKQPQGTSFSCAFTSSRVADFYSKGSTFPPGIKNELFNAAYTSPHMQEVTKEGKVIVTDKDN